MIIRSCFHFGRIFFIFSSRGSRLWMARHGHGHNDTLVDDFTHFTAYYFWHVFEGRRRGVLEVGM
jgi:hypothetical protein